jgi:hypothetical protein
METSIRLIAHRGNTSGSLPERENTVSYIEEAIDKGFDVEIDVRAIERKKLERRAYISPYTYILGHDNGETEVAYEWLLLHSDRLWVHCKDLTSLRALYESPLNYFWHQEDDFTLTSKNIIWTYPLKNITDKSVIVCFTQEEAEFWNEESEIFGICCDWVEEI